ncbi:MAG: hypothetical protein IMZ64_12440 [Bacteroidetes bacterium]|nr:hypothetical protein [Bacteroidota bacterium]
MKLFVDCDGVLTNFDKAVQALGPEVAKGLSDDAPETDKQVMYDAIEKAGESFWSKMEWTPNGKELWEVVKNFNPVLLSSPGRFSAAPSGKILWVKNNLPGTTLFLSENKSDYVDPYELSVLIDDMKKNIGAWEEAGGEGILHTSTADTERKFLELLWNVPEILDPSKIYW